jgi:GST-like protein
MIDLLYAPTPNGHKVTLFLEEAGLEYRVIPVNIKEDEQFLPDFLQISPNNKIPAIVDHEPPDGGDPMALFESGAILEYLADRTGAFLPQTGRRRYAVLQWLHWQMGGLGPMAGQNHHFGRFAPERIPYAIKRYVNETARLYGVLDAQLTDRDYIAGDYSIADMAAYPWVAKYDWQDQDLSRFPNVESWLARIAARPATQRAYARAERDYDWNSAMTEAQREALAEAAEAVD